MILCLGGVAVIAWMAAWEAIPWLAGLDPIHTLLKVRMIRFLKALKLAD